MTLGPRLRFFSILDPTAALVDERRPAIDTNYQNSSDVAWRHGHYCSGFAPGFSVVAVPVYLGANGMLGLLPRTVQQRLDAAVAASATMRDSQVNVRFAPRPALFALAHTRSIVSWSVAAVFGASVVVNLPRVF